ncbi:MAG: hypothetical protein C0391_03950 [Anaerolinea sp.]|nr:hypothetical protein [Anaerolinea sp.]
MPSKKRKVKVKMDDALIRCIENNLLSRLDKMEADIAALKVREMPVSTLDTISDDLGDQRAGRFLALSAGGDPTDADACGVFLSALGELFNAVLYHLGGVNNGVLQFGANAVNGKLMAGAGNVTLDEDGIKIVAGTAGGKPGQYMPNSLTFLVGADGIASLLSYLSGATGMNYADLQVIGTSASGGQLKLIVYEHGGTEHGSFALAIDGSDVVTATLQADITNIHGKISIDNFIADLVTDHSFNGETIILEQNESQAFGDAVYINSTGKAQLGDADAIATSNCVFMWVDNYDGSNKRYAKPGAVIRDDTWNWTVGGKIYLTVTGTTGNTLSQTAPTGTDDVIQILGIALTADIMLFQPQLVQVEHA